MTQKDANKMYEKENERIEKHNREIILDLDILSEIAGIKVLDYELSTDLTECHYGNKELTSDGFITIEKYNTFKTNEVK